MQRKLVYHVATTLDGFLSREDDSADCFPAEGDHIPEYLDTLKHTYGAVLMGRRTYEMGTRVGVTDPYPWLETHVFSRSMTHSPDPRVQLVSGDAAAYVRCLKAQEGKPLYLAGGGQLAGALFAEGLIDEVWVKLNPLLLGAGIPLVPRLERPLALILRASKTYRAGVVLLQYDVQR
jgi:dihydrofolate reductase